MKSCANTNLYYTYSCMNNLNLEKILLWSVKVGVLSILILPLYVPHGMLFPFITGKNFFFRFLIEIAFVLWIGLATMQSAYRPKLTLLFKSVTIFMVVLFFADLFSPNAYRAFFSNFERMEGFMMLFHLYLYFVLLVSVFKTKKDWLLFFYVTLGVSLVVGFLGFMQRFAGFRISAAGGYRIDSTIGNPAYLAAYLSFHVWLLGLLLRMHWKIWWLRFVYGALIAFELFLIYLTATRGAILGMLGGIILLLILSVVFGKQAYSEPRFRKLAIAALVFLAVLPIVLWSIRGTQFVRSQAILNRLTSISLNDQTTQSRFYIWQMSLRGALERPFLGWGQENYYLVFQKYFDPRLATQEPWFDRSHNIFLDWLVHTGFLGLISFLSIIGITLWGIWRALQKATIDFWVGATLGVLFVTHFLENLFVFDNLNTYLLFFGFLGFAHYSLFSDEKDNIRTHPSQIPMGVSVSAVLVVVVLMGGYFLHWKPAKASFALIQGLVGASQNTTSLSETQKHFREALAYDTFANTEIREQLGNFARGAVNNQQYPLEERKVFTALAIEELRKEILRPAKDIKHMLFLASILARAGELDPTYMLEAETLLKQALSLSPTKQIIYFELAQLYLTQNKAGDALATLQKAISLDPTYQQAVVNTAILGQLVGNKEAVDQALGFVKVNELDEDALRRIGTIYQQRQDFAEAKNVFIKLVAMNPDNAQYRATAAAFYAQFGEFDEAIIEAEAAARLDPAFAKEGQIFIEQLKAQKRQN